MRVYTEDLYTELRRAKELGVAHLLYVLRSLYVARGRKGEEAGRRRGSEEGTVTQQMLFLGIEIPRDTKSHSCI